jgi:hypothetical protein
LPESVPLLMAATLLVIIKNDKKNRIIFNLMGALDPDVMMTSFQIKLT